MLVIEVIPYKTFKERLVLVKNNKGKHIDIESTYIVITHTEVGYE